MQHANGNTWAFSHERASAILVVPDTASTSVNFQRAHTGGINDLGYTVTGKLLEDRQPPLPFFLNTFANPASGAHEDGRKADAAVEKGRAELAAAIHAVVPALFETTASRIVDELHARIYGPRCSGPAMIDPMEAVPA